MLASVRCGFIALLALSLGLLAGGASAKSAEATFHLEVPARAWKAGRLKDVPHGAKLAVEVRSDGPVALLLLDAQDYKRFPSTEQPLFRGETTDRLAFFVIAQKTGDYYVLIDNRTGSAARSVDLTVRGETGRSDGSEADAESKLSQFQAELHRLFVFDPFPIRIEQCGKKQAFGGPSGVVLCREYASELDERLQDKAKASDALLFTLFHEVGHVLLQQWSYPMHDSEEAADEFATAVMVMLGQKERVRAKAEFLRTHRSLLQAIAKGFRDEQHLLSEHRAGNLLRWLEEPGLVRRWQTILVPHMQTAVLERLKAAPTPWTDLALVEKELSTRQ